MISLNLHSEIASPLPVLARRDFKAPGHHNSGNAENRLPREGRMKPANRVALCSGKIGPKNIAH